MARPTYNLLDLCPERLHAWEEEDGRVVVLVPKFRHPFMVRWLMPFLRAKNFRVKLDGLGSAVWRACDGRTDVATIAERVKAEFGEAAEPLHDRIGSFLKKLEHGDLVAMPPPPAISSPTQLKED